MTSSPDNPSSSDKRRRTNRPEPSTSIWMDSSSVNAKHQLTSDIAADVCVVGAGIAGMTTAYLLAGEGKSVVVLDDGPVGGGETGRTTAHLTNALDNRYFEIERLHGAEGARLTAESHTAAISRIAAIINAEKIDCDFQRLDGYLFAAPDQSEDLLDRELDAAHRAGLVEVVRVARTPLDFDTGPSLRFPRQAQFHPLKYLAGLARAIERDNGRIFTFSHASKIEGGPDAFVATETGPVVTAKDIVVATNTPVNNVVAIHTKQAAYRTYVIGIQMPAGSVTQALYWDTGEPYHYLRLTKATAARSGQKPGFDILVVGGEDHKTGQYADNGDPYRQLEQWTRKRFPFARDVEFRWSGQVMETIDGLAFIGRNPQDHPNVYIITGDSGMGMTHCTIAGIILTDLIMKRENPWAELYEPARKRVGAAPLFIRENLNVIAQYAGQFTGGEVDNADQLASGTGGVLRRGLSKIAVYRDEDGTLHECSAVCPHLGCAVTWNSIESTWDCPCHGSRFDPYGRVINGPAISDLPPVEQTKDRSLSARETR